MYNKIKKVKIDRDFRQSKFIRLVILEKYLKNMEIKKIKIKGSFIINIKRLGDSRGYFSRIFCKKEFKKYNISNEISQVNCSYSKKKELLGHALSNKPHSEMKIIMCTKRNNI